MIKIFDESEQKVMTTKEVRKKYPKMGFLLINSSIVFNKDRVVTDAKGTLYAICDKEGYEDLVKENNKFRGIRTMIDDIGLEEYESYEELR